MQEENKQIDPGTRERLVQGNEQIRYYRSISNYEEALKISKEMLELVKELGLQESEAHGTTLLNAATAYRAAGMCEKAIAMYRAAEQIFKNLGIQDERLAEITILDEPAAGLDVIVREEFYKLIIDEQQENGRTFIISTHIIEEAANVFEEVIILKDKCVYLKENTVELLDKCRYVSGLEEDVKNAVDGCKIINEEHIGRSYAVTVMQDGDGKIKAVQHVTVQPVSLQNLFIAICGQSNM